MLVIGCSVHQRHWPLPISWDCDLHPPHPAVDCSNLYSTSSPCSADPLETLWTEPAAYLLLQELRKLIISAILATDMSYHFSLTTEFKNHGKDSMVASVEGVHDTPMLPAALQLTIT